MRRLLTLLFLLCPIAAAQQKPSSPIPGQVELHRPCAAKPGQTYALYIPSTYTPTKKWPIVYAFDPSARGDRPIDALKAGAEKYGYIIAASNNSRNGPWPPQIEAAQAVSDDTRALLSIDDHRIYQEVQGRRTIPLLETYDFPYHIIDRAEDIPQIPDAFETCRLQKRPFVLFLTRRLVKGDGASA